MLQIIMVRPRIAPTMMPMTPPRPILAIEAPLGVLGDRLGEVDVGLTELTKSAM